ncbi:MAG: hypothetical protein V1682_03630 [Candidatus Omnitrophota bacterium]
MDNLETKENTMFNICKLTLIGFMAIGLLLASPESYGQEETGAGKIRVFSGKVTNINWAGNQLTVSYRNEDTGISESITLSVPHSAVFRRESEDLSFSDIELQDSVQVEFTGDPMMNPVLITLNDMNLEND